MSERYIRITVTVDWGEMAGTLGKRQSQQARGTLDEMPQSAEALRVLVSRHGAQLAADLANDIRDRELRQKDVLQPKNYAALSPSTPHTEGASR